ncbi:MAG: helix-turn-helix domain-containing protein [Terriglobales bacterium]
MSDPGRGPGRTDGIEGLKQKDLLDIFVTPSIVSEVLSGKRNLTTEHIRKLSRRFQVSLELFI